MNDNYIIINGKKIELTDEQPKQLGIEPEKKRNNPFERVAKSEKYCLIDSFNEVRRVSDAMDQCDDMSFGCSNYFNDESFAKQVALHQLLYRKLLKFAYDNECEDTAEWNENNSHFFIVCDVNNNKYEIWDSNSCKQFTIYFSSEKSAERAIKEIVEPFVKEHPEFVW